MTLVSALGDAVEGVGERVAVDGEGVAQVLVEIRFELVQARQARLELAGHLLEFPGELAEPAVTDFAERVEHVGDLVHVAADAGEQGERAGELADLSDDVLDGDAAVLQSVREPFDQAYRFVDVGVELAVELVEERGELAAQRVDGGDGGVERLAQRFERELAGAFAQSAERGLHVGERALEGVAGGQCGSAEAFLHGVGECLEVDLAFGYHVGDLFRGFAEVFGEQLENGYAGAHELEHVVALQFASGGDAAEDGADVGEAAA